MTNGRTAKAVLAIGIDPAFVDLSNMPGFTPQIVRSYLETQINRVREFGYDVDTCLIDTGPAAHHLVETALHAKRYDCVVIGAGLREPPDLLLFERVRTKP